MSFFDYFIRRSAKDELYDITVKTFQSALSSAQGEITTLKSWVESLQNENKELKDIVFKKFGLVQSEFTTAPIESNKSIPMVPIWRTEKRKLENTHRRPTESLTAEQQKYWEEKNRKAEEAEKGEGTKIVNE